MEPTGGTQQAGGSQDDAERRSEKTALCDSDPVNLCETQAGVCRGCGLAVTGGGVWGWVARGPRGTWVIGVVSP